MNHSKILSALGWFLVGSFYMIIMYQVVDPTLTVLTEITYEPLETSTVAIIWFFVIMVWVIIGIIMPVHRVHQGLTESG